MGGSSADDVILGGDGVDLILAGSGNDHIDGGAQADILLAGDGNDTAIGGDGDDSISGQAGADVLIGGSGNDEIRETGLDTNSLYGGIGDDSLLGGDGTDFLSGGEGSDSVSGGGGNDIFLIDLNQQIGSIDTLSGGTGIDEVQVFFFDIPSFQAFRDEVDTVGFVTALENAGFIVVDDGGADQIEIFSIVPVGLGPILGDPVEEMASEQDEGFSVDLLDGTEDTFGAGLTVQNFRSIDDEVPIFNLVGSNFVLDPAQFEFLNEGESRSFDFLYDIVDGEGLSVSQTFVLSIDGANSSVQIDFAQSDLDIDIFQSTGQPVAGFIDFEDFPAGTLEPITDGFVTITSETGDQVVQSQGFTQIPGVFEGQYFGFSPTTFFIDFAAPVSVVSFGLFDLNSVGGTITALDELGGVIEQLEIGVDTAVGPPGGSTSQFISFTSVDQNITRIVVDPLGSDLTGIDQLSYSGQVLGGSALIVFDDPDRGDIHFAEILDAQFVGDTSGLPAGVTAESLLSLSLVEPGQESGLVTVEATVDQDFLEALAGGQALSIEATVEIRDEPGAGGTADTADVTFTFVGENEAPVLLDAQSTLTASVTVDQVDLTRPTGVIDFDDTSSGINEPVTDGFATVSTLDGNGLVQSSSIPFDVELISSNQVFESPSSPIIIEFEDPVDSVGLGVTAAFSSDTVIQIFNASGNELDSQNLNDLDFGAFLDGIGSARSYFRRDSADISRVEITPTTGGDISIDEVRYGFGALLEPTVNATFFDIDGVGFGDSFGTQPGQFLLEGSPISLEFPPIVYTQDDFQFINQTGDGTATRQTTLAIENNLFGFLAEGETLIAELPTDYQDDQDEAAQALFEFEIIGVNDAPLASNDLDVTDEDTLIEVDVLSNDIDIDLDQLSVVSIDGQAVTDSQITLASGATVFVNSTGTIDYDPSTSAINDVLEPGESRIETITYTVSDPGGETSSAELQIQVNGVGDFNVVSLNLFNSFNPVNTGSLYGMGVSPDGTQIAVIQQSGSTIDFYAPNGTFLRSIPLPGDRGNDGDLEFLGTELVLNGTTLPAGTLLVLSGDRGTADVFAIDPNDGTVLASIATDFGNSFTVGLTYNQVTGTLFLLTCNCDSDGNVIAEIDPNDGTTLSRIELDALDFQTFFGDLDSDPVTGDLFVVSDQETDILRLNTNGVVLERLELPAAVSGLSGVSVTRGDPAELYVGSTNGQVFQLGSAAAPDNLAPIVLPDFVTTDEASAVTINAGFNDIDPNGDILSFALVDGTGDGLPDVIVDPTPGLLDNNNQVVNEAEILATITDGNVNTFVSLPTGASITAFFLNEIITDQAGADIEILEQVNSEQARVQVSTDGVNFVDRLDDGGDFIPIDGTTQLDLADFEIDGQPVIAIRLIGLDQAGGFPGFDLAGIRALNGSTIFQRGLVTDLGNGVFEYDPNGEFDDLNAGEVDADFFLYEATDPDGLSSFGTVVIGINGIDNGNSSPIVNPIAAGGTEDEGIILIPLLPPDSVGDPDGDTLTLSNLQFVDGGPITPDAQIVGTNLQIDLGQYNLLSQGESGGAIFSYDVSDGVNAPVTNIVNLTVDGINDLPEEFDNIGDFSVSEDVAAVSNVDLLAGIDDPDANDVLSITDIIQSDGRDVNFQLVSPGSFQPATELSFDVAGVFDDLAVGQSEEITFTGITVNDGTDEIERFTDFTVTIQGANDPVIAVDDSSLSAGSEFLGLTINGVGVNDFAGAVADLGDLNNDGIDDFAVSAGSIGSPGFTRVIFGSADLDLQSSFNVATLDGSNGFEVAGLAADNRANVVSSAGDVNNDGIVDLLIGAPRHTGSGVSGEAYVIFGDDSIGAGGSFDLNALNGTNGFRVPGEGLGYGAQLGTSVASAGDINGDGIDDIVIGAPYERGGANVSGAAVIVFGDDTVGSTGVVDPGSLNGSNGFLLRGIDFRDDAGFAVSGVGDVNNDTIDDFVVGARFGEGSGPLNSGETYLVFGSSTVGGTGLLNASSLATNGVVINGRDSGDYSGFAVSAAGDVNDDGIADLLIGVPNGDPISAANGGETYLIFGSETLDDSTSLNLSQINGTNGIVIEGAQAGDLSGISLGALGDVNGDGIDDIIIGAPEGYGSTFVREGKAFVVFGSSDLGGQGPNDNRLRLAALDPKDGFEFNGITNLDFAGSSVSGGGDYNADGENDILIGALRADPAGQNSGQAYVIYGGEENLSALDANADGFAILNAIGGLQPPQPITTDEGTTLDISTDLLLANDIDIDGDAIFVSDVDQTSANGAIITLVGTTLTYDPNGQFDLLNDGQTQIDTFEYEVSDGNGSSDTATVTIVVSGISGNASPQVSVITDTVSEDDGQIVVPLASPPDVSDPDGDTLTASDLQQVLGPDAGGVIEANALEFFAGQFGSLGVNDTEILSFTYDVSDGINPAVQNTVTVTVEGVNDAPVTTGLLGDLTASEDLVELTVDLAAGVSDPDVSDAPFVSDITVSSGRSIPFVINSLSTEVTFSIAGFFDDLSATQSRDLTFDVEYSDGEFTATDLNAFTLTILGENDDPVAVDDAEDGSGLLTTDDATVLDILISDLLANDSDIDGDNLQIIDVQASVSGAQVLLGTGQITYDPNGAFDGASGSQTDTFTYTVSDGNAGTSTATVTVTIDIVGDFQAFDDPDGAATGFTLTAELYDAGYYGSIAMLGDINGDGIDDFILGTGIGYNTTNPYAPNRSGAAFVIFGSTDPVDIDLSQAPLDPSQGFQIFGAYANDYLGISVADAGDVNGDGIDDIIIGATGVDADPGSYTYDVGAAYIVFGRDTGFTDIDLAEPGSIDLILIGDDGMQAGYAVAGAGDVNGDGIDDVIVRAGSGYTPSSDEISFIVFGSQNFVVEEIALGSLDGTNGVRFEDPNALDGINSTVAGIGDFNGDTIDDVAIGRKNGDLLVVLGSDDTFPAVFTYNSTNSILVTGTDLGFEFFGEAIASGDLNGDGISDLIVSAPYTDAGFNDRAGSVYVIFGSDGGFPGGINVDNLNGANGFRLDGPRDYAGAGDGLSVIGDVNGDGIDDLLIGVPYGSNAPYTYGPTGEAYILFGRDGPGGATFDATLQLEDIGSGDGLRLVGFDETSALGAAVDGGGDLNGDGVSDLIIGVPGTGVSVSGLPEVITVFGGTSLLSLDGDGDGVINLSDVSPTGGAGFLTPENQQLTIDPGELTANDFDPEGDDLTILPFVLETAGGAQVSFTGGQITYDPDGAFDTLNDGETATDTFTYTVTDFMGSFDTATVTVNVTGITQQINVGDDTAITDEATPITILGADLLSNDIDNDGGGSLRIVSIDDSTAEGLFVFDGTDINYDPNGQFEEAPEGGLFVDVITYQVTDDQGNFATGTLNVSVNGLNDQVVGVDDLGALSIGTEFINGPAGFGAALSGIGDVNGDGIADFAIGAPNDATNAFNAGATFVIFGQDDGFGPSFDPATLNGSNGFVINGIGVNDRSGSAVSAAGDINGDGIGDILIGAYSTDANGVASSGEAHVVFGSDAGFAAALELSDLDGTNGFSISGAEPGAYAGASVAGIGDVNNDTFDDILIGASNSGSLAVGEEENFVIFGRGAGSPFGSDIDLSALAPTDGIIITGAAPGRTGFSAAGLGDVNGDGIDDYALGAYGFSVQPAGSVFVVFGTDGSPSGPLSLEDLDGTNGFVLTGVDSFDTVGEAISGAGDLNGDGIDDIIIGNSGGDRTGENDAGEAFVVFGSSSAFSQSTSLGSLNGTNGFVINGVDGGDRAGISVSGAGDVNGDGVDDVLIGAPVADPGSDTVGEAYVVFGDTDGFGASFDLSTIDGTNGIAFRGSPVGARTGDTVSIAGDVNGDGAADLLIESSGSGTVQLVLGGAGSLALLDPDGDGTIDLTDTVDVGLPGFVTGDAIPLNIATLDLLANDFDPDIGPFDVVSFVSVAASSTQGATLNESGGTITYDPTPITQNLADGETLVDTFTYTITDRVSDTNGTTDTATVSVLLIGANDPVSAVDDIAGPTDEDTPVDILAATLLANDDDPDDDALEISAIEAVSTSGATIGFDGTTVTYDPTGALDSLAEGDAVTDTFTYAVSDGNGSTSIATVSIDVSGVNDTPSALDDFLSTDSGVPVAFSEADLLLNDFDVDANDVIFLLDFDTTSTAGATIAIDGSGFVYDPGTVFDGLAQSELGFDSFTYTLSDGNLETTATVTVTVTGVSQPVTAVDDSELPSGFTLNGISAFDYSGISVSSAGDVNQDGIDDLIIGASGADQPGANTAGEAYIVFGAVTAPGDTLELAELNGTNGFVLTGIDGGGTAGFSVSNAGDVNGDTIDDVIIGAPGADANGDFNNGVSYVVFGDSAGFGASLDLGSLDGSNGFEITGEESFDESGTVVSSAGDVNNDGISDLLITAPNAAGALAGTGKSYIVFGSDTAFSPTLDLTTLDGTNGLELRGVNIGDYSGVSAASAGDVNGDGIDDIVIGARYADPSGMYSGQTYVVFGADDFASSIELSALDGSNGFVLNGVSSDDGSGISVSGGGDINGDQIDDLIIGAAYADPDGRSNAGESYVVFGSDLGFDPVFNLSTLDGSNGFVLNGIDSEDLSGTAVTALGDVSGDGIDDLLIGAYAADPDGRLTAGESYLVFGSDAGFSAELNLSSLDGTTGFILNGAAAGDESGRAVASAGDVNGDGTADLIIAAPGASPGGDEQAGQATVVFGGALQLMLADGAGGLTDGVIDLADIGADALGFSLRTTPDEALTIKETDLVANDLDGVGLGLEIVSTSGTSALGATIGFDGTEITYTPNGAFAGLGANQQVVDTFTYDVEDDSGGTDTATVSIVVSNPQNAPEILTANFSAVTEGNAGETTNVTFDLASILTAKDLDAGDTPAIDEASISIEAAANSDFASAGDFGQSGTSLLVDTASFDALSAGQFGLFDVTFDVVSGADRESASTRITIVGENDAPSLASDPLTFTALDNSPVLRIDALGNIVDPDLGDTFTVTSAAVTTSNVLLMEDFSDEVANAGGGTGAVLVQNIDAPLLDLFRVTTGSVDLQNEFDGGAGPELDLDGSQSAGSQDPAGQITSIDSFTFDPGLLYRLSFDLRAINDTDDVQVVIGSLLNETVTADALQRITFEFQAPVTESASVVFTNLGVNDNLGAAISNITLEETATVSIDSATGEILFDPTQFDAALVDGDSQLVTVDYTVSDGTVSVDGSIEVGVSGTGSNGSGSSTYGGTSVIGTAAGDASGTSVANLGDINGDGFDDVIIGVPLFDVTTPYASTDAGAAFVIFGDDSLGNDAEINLAALNPANGFQFFYGYGDMRLGSDVSGAGDFNGDGFNDFLVTAYASGDARTTVFLVYGSSTIGSTGTFQVDNDDFYNGYAARAVISSGDPTEVAAIGDINGDGFDDFAFGVTNAREDRLGIGPDATTTSLAAVVFGTDAGVGGYGGSISFDELDGSNGFFVRAPDGTSGLFAESISGGDINGDTIDDLVISDLTNDSVYVIFGSETVGSSGEFVISDTGTAFPNLLDGTNGFTAVVSGPGVADFGNGVDASGDIDNDGFNDIAIGSLTLETAPGEFLSNALVILGDRSLPISTGAFDFTNQDQVFGIGFVAGDAGIPLGPVEIVGDINNDGFDDVLVATVDQNGDPQGFTYLVFGGFGLETVVRDPTSLDGDTGYIFRDPLLSLGSGFAEQGAAIGAAGDVNGDGIDDLVLGGPGIDTNNGATSGESLIIFGGVSSLADLDAADGSVDGVIGLENIAPDIETFNTDASIIISSASFGTGAPSSIASSFTGDASPVFDAADLPELPISTAVTEEFGDGSFVFSGMTMSSTTMRFVAWTGNGPVSAEPMESADLTVALDFGGIATFNTMYTASTVTEGYRISPDAGVLNVDYTLADIQAAIIGGQSTSGDDEIIGTTGNDSFTAGLSGDDLLRGLAGDDFYDITLGTNRVEIDDGVNGGTDTVRVNGIASSSADLARAGLNGDDLIISNGEGGEVVIRNTLSDNFVGGVDMVIFDDATLSMQDLRARILEEAVTEGSDQVVGFATDDTLTGGAGEDLLSGGLGEDTFVFDIDDGIDVIEDTSLSDTDQDLVRFVGRTLAEADLTLVDATLGIVQIDFGNGDRAIVVDAIGDDASIESFKFDDQTLSSRDLENLV